VRQDDLPRLRAVAVEHGLTAYDAGYLELAMRNRLPLATLDEGLRRAAKKAGVVLL
jgi:predicted nucleic acid-binding protein